MTSQLIDITWLASINAALCNEFGGEFKIDRPHNIQLIAKQDAQLSNKSTVYRSCYAAKSIVKLRPFASNNLRTAVCVIASNLHLDKKKIRSIGGLLKHDVSVDHIVEAVSS